jgi:hypothetical protein
LEAAEKAFKQARESVGPEADRVWGQLTPTIEYLADNANLYAIKPIVMLDAMRLSMRDAPDQRTRLALGAGLQFNIVMAKLEVGYMRTVRRMPGDQRGNVTTRIIFDRLF